MAMHEQFLLISGDAALKDFLAAYGFREIKADAKWNIGEYETIYQGLTYRVGYRWHDPSQVYSIQRDVHKAQLWSIDAAGGVLVRGNIEFDEGA
ncbi:TPA: hypothetical protein VDB83_004917 [Burkholderia cenocepacia]|nr:hypothetical protein [Burkholderia cenocepacia]